MGPHNLSNFSQLLKGQWPRQTLGSYQAYTNLNLNLNLQGASHNPMYYACLECDRRFRSVFYLTKHLPYHQYQHVCACGKRFQLLTSLQKHVHIHAQQCLRLQEQNKEGVECAHASAQREHARIAVTQKTAHT